MSIRRLSYCATLCTSAFLLISLAGCADEGSVTPNTPFVTGNWQLASTAPTASKLPALSGELSGTSAAATAILHSDSATACVSPSTAIDLSGSANAQGVLTLTGGFSGGTLTISGTLAANGKSLTNATYDVTGGTCAFASPAVAVANDFSPITGNYAGSFSDPGGQVITVNATLTQSPASDPNGNFTLSGTGTFPANPCFNSPVTVSNSQVTGGSFTFTYADSTTQNSVTANGTFSTDGTTLTVTNWTLTGSCGPDSGTGLLTKQ